MPRLSREQFETLVTEHHAAVHRSAARLLDSAAEAADVTQDVFVRVLEGKVRLDAAQSVRATLCWLATALARNARRSRRRRQDHEENAMNEHLTREADDPARVSAERDMQRAVLAVMETLPEDLRLPLQLRCQDELTFAAIGTALRIPESTAHDRVQQALQRLRTSLSGRGFAVATAGVPELLRSLPIQAPADLQARLLALGGEGAVTVTAGLAARLGIGLLSAAAVIGVAAYTTSWLGETAGEPAPAGTDRVAAMSAPAEPGTGQEPAPPTPDAARTAVAEASPVLIQENPAPKPIERLHGTVHDSGAWPVAGATVQVVAAGGLKAFQLAVVTTDQAGAFQLEFDPTEWHPSAVRLQVLEDRRLLLETPELALPRAADAAPLALVLSPEVGTALSRYELLVAVADEAGVALADVPVTLLEGDSPRPGYGGGAGEVKTGGDGMATLSGRSLGAKWLFVDGRPFGRVSHFELVQLDRAGAHRANVALPAGGALQARITTLQGALLEWGNVWLEDEATGLGFTGKLDGDGVASFRGLGKGTHTLHVTADWSLSPVRRSGLRAGAPMLELRLKPRAEEQDVGDHMAELHGELFDAATGEILSLGGFAVDVRPGRAGDTTLPTDRIVPRGPVQQMESGQTFTRFHEVGLTAGRWALVTDVPGYATAVLEVELRDREIRTGLRVPLHRGGEIRGVVRDARGQPVRRAHVFLVGIGELADRCVAEWRTRDDAADRHSATPTQLCSSAWTDEAGAFRLRDVPPDAEVRIVARHPEAGFAVLPGRVLRSGEQQVDVEVRLGAR